MTKDVYNLVYAIKNRTSCSRTMESLPNLFIVWLKETSLQLHLLLAWELQKSTELKIRGYLLFSNVWALKVIWFLEPDRFPGLVIRRRGSTQRSSAVRRGPAPTWRTSLREVIFGSAFFGKFTTMVSSKQSKPPYFHFFACCNLLFNNSKYGSVNWAVISQNQ